jgi:hypothetical protein
MYIRVIENCHPETAHPKFKDTERNSLFCPTRFVAQADAKAVPQDVLDNQTLEDGSKAPVILIGHGWNFDEHALKKEFNLSTPKLEGIVFEIKSLGRLAEQAGIIPAPQKALGESYPNFDHMLEAGFMINLAGTWRHNGANNAVYQMTLAFLIALFPLLYPNTASGSYPSDPTIEGQTINEIWQDLACYKDTMLPLAIGYERLCFYCETAEDHDTEDCPTKSSLVCSYCANAMGSQNKRYRVVAVGHSNEHCAKRYNHHVRQFPEWLEKLELSLENKRKLSQAMALKDSDLIGSVFYLAILGGGPMGDYEVAELEANDEKRLQYEATQYSRSEEEEVQGTGEE